MDFRHEWKHQINTSDVITLENRLSIVMQPDPHAVDGIYHIHSLYFDDLYNKAFHEKEDGMSIREKFRIRYYNENTDFIKLEKKTKVDNLSNKIACPISRSQVESILSGNYQDILSAGDKTPPLMRELYMNLTSALLKPKVLIDYRRKPFIYPYGNIRVTIDYDVQTSLEINDFLIPSHHMLPIAEDIILLEVKWDEYLPDVIKSAVWLPGRQKSSFSKYSSGRIYG